MPNLISPANTVRSRTENLIRALDALFKPKFVKLIVAVDVLPQLGWIGDHVAAEFADYRGVMMPRMVLNVASVQDAEDAKSRYEAPHHDDKQSEKSPSPRVSGANTSIRVDGSLQGVVDPLPNSDCNKSSRNRSPVWPVSADASDERGSGHTRNRMPPMEVFADSRNTHRVTPSPVWHGVQPFAPSTLADDIGCLIAIASLGAAAYFMLVLA